MLLPFYWMFQLSSKACVSDGLSLEYAVVKCCKNVKVHMASICRICIFVISNNKSFISQNLKFVCPLGGKYDFLSPSGFEIQSGFDYRISKIKVFSVRALKGYLN